MDNKEKVTYHFSIDDYYSYIDAVFRSESKEFDSTERAIKAAIKLLTIYAEIFNVDYNAENNKFCAYHRGSDEVAFCVTLYRSDGQN